MPLWPRLAALLARKFGAGAPFAAPAPQPGQKLYAWGGLELPDSTLGAHFAALGTTGSGKTTIIRLLMGSVLPGPRALVLDPKREFLPILCGIGVPRDQIHILDPFAQGSEAWDIARDITTPAAARQFAADIIPVEKGHDHQFFRTSTRATVHALVVTFQKLAPGQWQFNDIIEATRTPKQLDAILSLSLEGQEVLQTYLNPAAADLRANVFASIRERLAGYEEIAALWAHTARKFSIRDWMRGKHVMLLALDDAHASVLAPINAAMFATAINLCLARPAPRSDDETWIFIDEAREAGELPGLRKALNKGRSAGFRIVLGAQDLVGLRSVYKSEAEEMLAQVANLCMLRQENPDTREWGARYLGEYEYWQLSHGQSTSSQGVTTSWQQSLTKRQLMLPQELGTFPLADFSRGVFGVCTAPHIGAWRMYVSPDLIMRRLHPPAPGVAAFIPRPLSDQARVPLTATLIQRQLAPPVGSVTNPLGAPPAAPVSGRPLRRLNSP